MVRIILTSLFVGGLIIGGWLLRHQFWPSPAPPPETGETVPTREQECPHSVNALGYLLPRDGILSVSGTPGDQLAMLMVKEGDLVSQGQLLAELLSKDLRYLEWQARESQRIQAERQFAAEKTATEKRLAAARVAQEKIALQQIEESAQQDQIAFLRSNLRLARQNLERLRDVRESLVPAQTREQQELLVEKTETELRAAESTLERMQAAREHAVKEAQAELEVVEAGLAQVKAADQSRSLELAEQIAKLQYEQTMIEAPAAGTVLKTFVQPGETLSAQPILQMADLDHMICQAEVFQTDIQCVRVGQAVRVTSPAFPSSQVEDGIPGTVRRISRLVAAPKLQSLDPYAAADRHVVEVEIEFDLEASRVAGQFVNLQVQVEFLVDADG